MLTSGNTLTLRALLQFKLGKEARSVGGAVTLRNFDEECPSTIDRCSTRVLFFVAFRGVEGSESGVDDGEELQPVPVSECYASELVHCEEKRCTNLLSWMRSLASLPSSSQ
jgi:hypothetical protein